MNTPDRGLARLDYFVSERLAALRISRGELARRGGPSRSTLNKAMSAARIVSPATLSRLDASLGWAPGSAAAILDGGTPTCRLPRTVGGDLCSAEHAHVITVLSTVFGMLEDASDLLAELLAPSLRRPRGGHRGGV
ncbi:helix-turn-helix domain-containing protein [Mycobacterium kansasii]